MNSKYFLSAIHQRVESDGTERVEESMTQRLENILNSKRLLIHTVAFMQCDKPQSATMHTVHKLFPCEKVR